MGQKLSREAWARGLPVHNNEANQNDGLIWKWLGGLCVIIIALSGFFLSAFHGAWSSGNPSVSVARYAASSNVTASNQDAGHSASSASPSKTSWTIIGVASLVGGVMVAVVMTALTILHSENLHGRAEKRRVEKEKKRGEEKESESREMKELERRREVAKRCRHRRVIQHLKFLNLDLRVKRKSEIHYHTRDFDIFLGDHTLRDGDAYTSESKEQV